MGMADSEAVVEWAISELEMGNTSNSLSTLAGLTPPVHWQELERYLHQAIVELDWSVPSEEECLRAYVRDVAREIVSGAVPPLQGCREIYNVTRILEYPADLTIWLYLDDQLEPDTYHDLVGTALEQAIVRQAASLIASSEKSTQCR